jgi:glyoxylase-like metal-dependent hydrolase (beta-lactamase superfamily II)
MSCRPLLIACLLKRPTRIALSFSRAKSFARPQVLRMASISTLRVVPIPAFTDNYIWCIIDSKSAVIVDPGDAKPAIEYLEQQGVSLSGILITHHHADHTGGIKQLVAWARGRMGAPVPVYGPAAEHIPERTHAVSAMRASYMEKL